MVRNSYGTYCLEVDCVNTLEMRRDVLEADANSLFVLFHRKDGYLECNSISCRKI